MLKKVGKAEQEVNLKLFHQYNREERELMRELILQDRERLDDQNVRKKLSVFNHYREKRLKRSNMEFSIQFA